jgi:hypothetical protein
VKNEAADIFRETYNRLITIADDVVGRVDASLEPYKDLPRVEQDAAINGAKLAGKALRDAADRVIGER